MSLRSEIVVHDCANGEGRVVFATDDLIEAPNWSPRDNFLVFNGGGLLYRLDLDGGAPRRIDTGFARACNNDHGISPDGSALVISDGTEEGRSCVYALPIGGGSPKRLTANVPSYWHGWSPDGSTLAFVGGRGGVFDIYSIPADGGDEVRLTDGAGHHDGPDYTPDGSWIWFNSDRGGTMQLWRMRADGGGLQQMTRDDRVNWFPHPSPDGRALVYLAYERDVTGHPRDRHVELRLIDPEGGDMRIVASLFGGQGTINVPSWSPDSRQFAYVRYAPIQT